MNRQSEYYICRRVVDNGDQGNVCDVDYPSTVALNVFNKYKKKKNDSNLVERIVYTFNIK